MQQDRQRSDTIILQLTQQVEQLTKQNQILLEDHRIPWWIQFKKENYFFRQPARICPKTAQNAPYEAISSLCLNLSATKITQQTVITGFSKVKIDCWHFAFDMMSSL